MSHAKSFEAYGRYQLARDRLNAVLDAAIIQETRLRVFHGVLLVAPLTTKHRLAILKAVLAQAGGERAHLVPLVAEITQELKRLPVGQAQASLAPDGSLSFLRTEVGPRTAGAVATFAPDEVEAAAAALESRVAGLAEALGIDDAALATIQRSVVEALARPAAEELA